MGLLRLICQPARDHSRIVGLDLDSARSVRGSSYIYMQIISSEVYVIIDNRTLDFDDVYSQSTLWSIEVFESKHTQDL